MPKFQRVSLVGSDELFRPTKVEPDAPVQEVEEAAPPAEAPPAAVAPAPQTGPAPSPAAPADMFSGRTAPAPPPPAAPQPTLQRPPAPAPLSRENSHHRLTLTEGQIRVLVDAVQRMKYPHAVSANSKPSIDEFEHLEALRNQLLDALE